MNYITEVNRLVNDLWEKYGINCIIAGGAARDVYHGRTPKDYDVIFTKEMTTANIMMCLEGLGIEYQILDTFNFHFEQKHFVPSEELQVSVCSSDDRIMYGVKIKLFVSQGDYSGPEVDLLVYNCDSLGEAVSMFDYNINQFVIRQDGEAVFAGKFHPYMVGCEPVRGLGDSPRDVKRKEKLEALAKELGYGV